MVEKQDYVAWRNNPVTQELHKVVLEAIEGYAAEIINRETPNEARDQLIRGSVKSLVMMMEWEPEFVPEETDEEETQDGR